jgi:type II secretion system protein C
MRFANWLALAGLGICTALAVDVSGALVHGFQTKAPSTGLIAPAPSPVMRPVDEGQANRQTTPLFGEPPPPLPSSAASASPAAAVEPVPPLPTSIVLIGTLCLPGNSVAVLEVDGKSRSVQKGDTVSGFTVAEIREDRVRFEMRGVARVLRFPSIAGTAPAVAIAPPRPRATPPPAARPQPRRGPLQLHRGKDNPERRRQSFVVSASARSAAFSNPSKLYQTFRAVPAPGDHGARLEYVQPGSLLEQMGVRQGDVLTRMNGRPVSSESAPDVIQTLRLENRAVLQVQRDGHPVHLRVDFR